MKLKITDEQKRDIWKAFQIMLERIDFNQMATVMNVLCPQRSFYVVPNKLKDDVIHAQELILAGWPKDKDGNYEIDLDNTVMGHGTMGYMLEVVLDEDTDIWRWELSLCIANECVYQE
jgi:hypothetical protein